MASSESNSPQTPEIPAATYLRPWNPQEDLQNLLRIAAAICEVQNVAINLLDEEGNPVKACVGQNIVEAPMDSWFCSSAIRHTDLFVVPDLREDPRFCDSSFVTGEPYLRFFAGHPLTAIDYMQVFEDHKNDLRR